MTERWETGLGIMMMMAMMVMVMLMSPLSRQYSKMSAGCLQDRISLFLILILYSLL